MGANDRDRIARQVLHHDVAHLCDTQHVRYTRRGLSHLLALMIAREAVVEHADEVTRLIRNA